MADDDTGLKQLQEIKHIVVLMMENRSFDQMLGYLQQDDLPDVRGLDGTQSNPGADGKPIPAFEWGPHETSFHPNIDPSGKILDPCHSEACVAKQLADGNQGFVRNFLETRVSASGEKVSIPEQYHRLPMGHYGAQHLPVYDFLARNYCVCDAWHSSVPGDTWPNRLFSIAGHAAKRTPPSFLHAIEERFHKQLHALENAPIFEVEAFTRQLADSQWRWYSHDPATLRAADKKYRDFLEPDRGNFAFFNRQRMSLLTKLLEHEIVSPDSFLDDAAGGRLREVSWIDPNFIDLKVLDPVSNDDHPPSDVREGQGLVLETYEALRHSPEWEDTLLLVVYDEHGGFYDHVAPPMLPSDDGSGHRTYGVRVPALVIGPRVRKEVSHQLFDHTSIIKTILLRFAEDPDGAIARMGARVAAAEHLGVLLADAPRTGIPEAEDARAAIDAWHQESRAARRASAPGPSPAADGAGRPLALHDFQEDFVKFALAMRWHGLKANEP